MQIDITANAIKEYKLDLLDNLVSVQTQTSLIKSFSKQCQADLSALGIGDAHGEKPNLE